MSDESSLERAWDVPAKPGDRIAVGDRLLEVGSPYGAAVVAGGPTVPARRRDDAPELRPDPPAPILGRDAELASLREAIAERGGTQLAGEPGSGRTSLLARLGVDADVAAFPGGVVYLAGQGLEADDVAQALFDAWHEPIPRVKATLPALGESIGDARALVLLDDVDAATGAAAAAALPGASVVFSTTGGQPLPSARLVALRGLDEDAILAVVANELGRELTEEEAGGARALAAVVAGNPLRLRQALAVVRDDPARLGAVAQHLAGGDAPRILTRQALAGLGEPEQRVVATLALPRNASLRLTDLDALAGVGRVERIVDELIRRGLASREGDRCRLVEPVAGEVEAAWPLGSLRTAALTYIADWAGKKRNRPQAVGPEAALVAALAEWAVADGRHREALTLAGLVDAPLSLTGRWGPWGRTLEAARSAATALGDRSAEAWALHQQGVRALALGDAPTAHAVLSRAADLREADGDEEAVTATRRVLEDLLEAEPTAATAALALGSPAGPRTGIRLNRRTLIAGGIGAAVVAGIAVGVVLATGGDDSTKPAASPSEPPAAPQPSPSEPSPSPSPSPTPEEPAAPPQPTPEEPAAPTPTPPPPAGTDTGSGPTDTEPTPDPPTPPEPAPAQPGETTLQIANPGGPAITSGSRGPRVRQLQQALKRLGYEVGTVDGAYGPSTRDAIRAFQQDSDLEADGVAGETTIRAINKALRQQA